jgi:hypothetical protein
MRLKIDSEVNLLGLLVGRCFAAVIGSSVMALSQLRVGGPVYHQNIEGVSRVTTQSNGVVDRAQQSARLLTDQAVEMRRFIDRLLTEVRAA